MSRQSWVQDRRTGKLIPKDEYYAQPERTHMIAPDFYEYESPIDGAPVIGRKQRREDLKRHGCRPYEAGEKEDYIRRRNDAERAEGQRIEQFLRNGFG